VVLRPHLIEDVLDVRVAILQSLLVVRSEVVRHLIDGVADVRVALFQSLFDLIDDVADVRVALLQSLLVVRNEFEERRTVL